MRYVTVDRQKDGLILVARVLLLAVYSLVTALIGPPYWTMEGAAARGAEINFYKNISIIGGLLLLFVTGPGRYSLDRK